MNKRIYLDEVLARYGASYEDVKAAGVLDKWEMRAIEREDYGRLRLSSSVKIALVVCDPEADIQEESRSIMLSWVDRPRSSE